MNNNNVTSLHDKKYINPEQPQAKPERFQATPSNLRQNPSDSKRPWGLIWLFYVTEFLDFDNMKNMFYVITAKVITWSPYHLLRIRPGVGWLFMLNFVKFHGMFFALR